MEYFTAMEAAVYAHKSEKTIRLWIAQGKLPAKKVAVKGLNQWAIDKRDIDAALSAGGSSTGIASDAMKDITGRIDGHDEAIGEIKSTVDELQRQIEELKMQIEDITELVSQPPTHAPARAAQSQPRQPREHTQASTVLSGGLIAFRQFADQHGIPGSTAKNAVDTGRLEVTEGAWKAGNAIIKKAFDAEQQRAFVEAYRHHASFHQCEREGCPCRK